MVGVDQLDVVVVREVEVSWGRHCDEPPSFIKGRKQSLGRPRGTALNWEAHRNDYVRVGRVARRVQWIATSIAVLVREWSRSSQRRARRGIARRSWESRMRHRL